MTWRIAVDSGGTFTDIYALNESTGASSVWKTPSTPEDPSIGILNGVAEALERNGASARQVGFLGHGTTVATNALIQLRGARTGLLTTAGFRDLLEIGRQKRPHLYDNRVSKPEILVKRALRLEVPERMTWRGEVEVPLDEDAVRAAAARFREAAVEAVAICFLYSFNNPQHERRALQILRDELPDVFLCASCDVAPEFREYERLSTVVVNAYLGPVMRRYIDRLYRQLKTLGVAAEPKLTQSNGGAASFQTAASLPVRTILSGPTTGLVAAQAIASQAGFDNIITFDMGGTSSDVSLLCEGGFREASEAIASGYPIKAPMLDIQAVGAGGGSIAYVDSGGLLKVGPRSAGAFPGPVCYGKGNVEPTVTDANVVLGTLNPEFLLGGRMPVRRELAVEAIRGLAEPLGMDVMAAAHGIIAVATANMAKAIRVVSVQRGHDPRDYALFAFGGAGPLHAARLARELDVDTVVVPPTPGALCAMGLLMTDIRTDFLRACLLDLAPESIPRLQSAFADLRAQADIWFRDEGIADDARAVSLVVDMRYAGQNYELSLALDDAAASPDLDGLRSGFEDLHRRQYGFADEGGRVQIVTCRLSAFGRMQKISLPELGSSAADAAAAVTGHRDAWFAETGGAMCTPVYDRRKLAAGIVLQGPAIIEQMDTTTVVLPGMSCTVDVRGNLILKNG